jgi:CubicO group peptidase (beta-lactamase class C family)
LSNLSLLLESMRMTRFLRGLTLLLAVLATATPTQGQTAARNSVAAARDQFDSVRAVIRRAIDGGLPSVSVAVAKDGRIIWEEGFGMANRERGIRAGPHTMYSLASISKPFTATGLMKLVERGKVQLDRPANEYLGPGRLTALSGDASQATVRRIMSHTAGLPLHYQFFYENAAYRRPSMDTTISRYGILVNPPGDVYQYSNLGYGILDHIISRVSRQSYADYMREEVFLPLGLAHTSVDIASGLEPHVAQRYDSKLRPIAFYTFDHPGGSAVYSSAHDLVRFGMFHLKNRLPGQQRILADSTIDAMQRIYTPDTTTGAYGLGWSVSRDDNGYRRVSHSGGMPGVNTVLALYPSENVAVVVLANQSGATPFRVAEEIAATILPGYATERAARRARQAAAMPTPPPAFPPAELAGAWIGTLRTYDGTTPLALLFQPDGDVHVTLGNRLKTLLTGASFNRSELTGRFLGAIPTEEQRRHAYSVLLNVRLHDGVLRGQASAMSTEDPVYYALTSYVELRKVADRALTAADAARYAGTYTTAFGATVRVTTEADKLKIEGGGRSRVFLYQGDDTFVASEDPGVRAVFRLGTDGKASMLSLTLGGQTTEARR